MKKRYQVDLDETLILKYRVDALECGVSFKGAAEVIEHALSIGFISEGLGGRMQAREQKLTDEGKMPQRKPFFPETQVKPSAHSLPEVAIDFYPQRPHWAMNDSEEVYEARCKLFGTDPDRKRRQQEYNFDEVANYPFQKFHEDGSPMYDKNENPIEY